MKLYKYVNSDRVDILINAKIRFTQPYIWNDPFELQPYYKDHIPKNADRKFLELLKMINNSQFSIEAIEEYKKESERITKEDVYSFINKNLIGLSLTEDKDNLLMWAHYASQHSGFILEFDTENEFFQNKGRFLFKVGYDINRPDVDTLKFAESIINIIKLLKQKQNPTDDKDSRFSPIFRKSEEWKYEKEWRLITTVDEAFNHDEFKKNMNVMVFGEDSELNRTYLGENYIALFNIPISCIKSIYCGARMKRSKIRQLFFLNKYNSNYSHIKLVCSEIDDKIYKINFREVSENDVLTVAELIYEHDSNKKKLKYKLDYSIHKYKKEKKYYSRLNPISNKLIERH